MLLRALRAPVFATNTLILAPHDGGAAVVVDPGAGAAPLVRAFLAERELHVGAVVVTRGHPDHVWDCAAVAPDAPVLVGRPDADRLAGPAGHIGPRRPGPPPCGLAPPWRPPRPRSSAPPTPTVSPPRRGTSGRSGRGGPPSSTSRGGRSVRCGRWTRDRWSPSPASCCTPPRRRATPRAA